MSHDCGKKLKNVVFFNQQENAMSKKEALIQFFLESAKCSPEEAAEAAQTLLDAQQEGRLADLLTEALA
jgi:hypothetical protein